MNTELFGFARKGNSIVPGILVVISKPERLPVPCRCDKCAHAQEWMLLQGSWDQVLQVLQNKGGDTCKNHITKLPCMNIILPNSVLLTLYCTVYSTVLSTVLCTVLNSVLFCILIQMTLPSLECVSPYLHDSSG